MGMRLIIALTLNNGEVLNVPKIQIVTFLCIFPSNFKG